ncbi:hypothetical protein GGI12_001001 [Dipsacomyces acuminosporus]|nr:hypothetical protein GGI12_001001 [Dipsacomyces acuminosporus]
MEVRHLDASISLQLALVAFVASVSAWDPSQMPEKLRKELCAEQMLFCTNICGGEALTREAFCNPATLGSKCLCTNGAEAAIRRYQWPAFQRACEAQRDECRQACNRSDMAAKDRSVCFNTCDLRLACGTDNAPDLNVMVQKFDDPTGSPAPKAEDSKKTDGAEKDASKGGESQAGKGDSKIKERPADQSGAPKHRGGPLNGTNAKNNDSTSAGNSNRGSAAMAVALSVAALAAVSAKRAQT